MKIKLNNVGKRFNREWIFRNIDYEFTSEHAYAILGANGSGKSTLLQVIASSSLPSEGTLDYSISGDLVVPELVYRHVSFASPYIELLEEYTLDEMIDFHGKFKSFFPGLKHKDILKLIQLEKSKDKAIKYFSSGMRQRVKLGLAILSNTPLLCLDEPASNLDKEAIKWYQQLISEFSKDRLILVCSNQQRDEYDFCTQEFSIADYK